MYLATPQAEQNLVTIEFKGKDCPDAKFTFLEEVILKSEYPSSIYKVKALRIVTCETPSGESLVKPRWMYQVVDENNKSFWKEEFALERYENRYEEELDLDNPAFPSEIVELDRAGYPMQQDAAPVAYFPVNSIDNEPF